MTKFKVGDTIRRITNPARWAPIGYETTVLGDNYYLGKGDRYPYKIIDEMWELVEKTHFPLYSEKEAVKLLTERGYEVKAPPEPLKGQFVIVMTPSGNPHAIAKDRYDKNDYSLVVTAVLAIVDWTEGQGI